MSYTNTELVHILQLIDLGSSIAEQDTLLETTRVETSVFTDLLTDKVDLIPGTKGSGKSALYRIFVDFLPEVLFESRKVVIAHGVKSQGNSVFHAFKDEFAKLHEDDFVNFWLVYVISLVHEQFIKSPKYTSILKTVKDEIKVFLLYCQQARIPEIQTQKSLYDILNWTLNALAKISPKIRFKFPDNSSEVEVDLFGNLTEHEKPEENKLPQYAEKLKYSLEEVLNKTNLTIWIMIDKLDEIFLRRSPVERKALRGLLKVIKLFLSDRIRIKVFLRDDMFREVVRGSEGFTALTHVTARQSDTLRWSEDQILTLIVKRLFANRDVRNFLDIDKERLDASLEYRRDCFKKVFPPKVHKGSNQSSTLRWIYNHTADSNGVVTPRDVIDLLTKAKQFQHSRIIDESTATSEWIFGSQAIQYGLKELSDRKRATFLQAEFPHLWEYMEALVEGKSEYTEKALKKLYGKNWENITNDLASIGLLGKTSSHGQTIYKIPFVYRKGLELTQGRAT